MKELFDAGTQPARPSPGILTLERPKETPRPKEHWTTIYVPDLVGPGGERVRTHELNDAGKPFLGLVRAGRLVKETAKQAKLVLHVVEPPSPVTVTVWKLALTRERGMFGEDSPQYQARLAQEPQAVERWPVLTLAAILPGVYVHRSKCVWWASNPATRKAIKETFAAVEAAYREGMARRFRQVRAALRSGTSAGKAALETLDLAPGASPEDIKAAWRAFAMKHHPDRGGDAEAFKRGRAAFELLTA
jgi:hypothetical protein